MGAQAEGSSNWKQQSHSNLDILDNTVRAKLQAYAYRRSYVDTMSWAESAAPSSARESAQCLVSHGLSKKIICVSGARKLADLRKSLSKDFATVLQGRHLIQVSTRSVVQCCTRVSTAATPAPELYRKQWRHEFGRFYWNHRWSFGVLYYKAGLLQLSYERDKHSSNNVVFPGVIIVIYANKF